MFHGRSGVNSRQRRCAFHHELVSVASVINIMAKASHEEDQLLVQVWLGNEKVQVRIKANEVNHAGGVLVSRISRVESCMAEKGGKEVLCSKAWGNNWGESSVAEPWYLKDGDSLIEVMVFHCRGAVNGSQGRGTLHHEGVGFSSMVEVMTEAGHIKRNALRATEEAIKQMEGWRADMEKALAILESNGRKPRWLLVNSIRRWAA